jgi:hypothetical protein
MEILQVSVATTIATQPLVAVMVSTATASHTTLWRRRALEVGDSSGTAKVGAIGLHLSHLQRALEQM